MIAVALMVFWAVACVAESALVFSAWRKRRLLGERLAEVGRLLDACEALQDAAAKQAAGDQPTPAEIESLLASASAGHLHHVSPEQLEAAPLN